MMTPDYKQIIVEGLREEIVKRWPEIVQTMGQYTISGGNFHPFLLLGLSDCNYAYIHIIAGEDIFIDADDSYGPKMQFKYEDYDCIDNVLAFIMAVTSQPKTPGQRRWLGGDPIDLAEWRIAMGQKLDNCEICYGAKGGTPGNEMS